VKLLQDILYRTRLTEVHGSTNAAVEYITMDSRKVKPMSLFVAIKGVATDGHAYITTAVKQGAVAIICESLPKGLEEHVTYVVVPNSSHALGIVASNFYDNPSDKLRVIAVTGTNGKTTTATLLYRLFRKLKYKCGLISTVVNKIIDQEIPSTHTTPDAVALQSLLAQMVAQGCTYCFMEASSHALHQERMAGMTLTAGIFTNITHDHLDYHGSFNEYIKAKKLLFDQLPKAAFALVNHDDRHCEVMVQNCKAKVKRYALQSMADYRAKVIENSFAGLHITIDSQDLYTRLIGAFNAYNILAVYATAIELGLDKIHVLTAISELDAPDGRFQYIRTEKEVTAVIDYAHTPDALQNVLDTIGEIRTGNEQVITVVGCGGDRDKTKRPLMAQIAANASNRVILTSDNPRSEDPEVILSEMKSGLDPSQLRKVITLADRQEAIRLACEFAQSGDIILIAGKGHEKYQEINGVKKPFDDYEVAYDSLKMLGK